MVPSSGRAPGRAALLVTSPRPGAHLVFTSASGPQISGLPVESRSAVRTGKRDPLDLLEGELPVVVVPVEMPEHFADFGQPPGGVTVTLPGEDVEDLAEQPPQFGALPDENARRELVDRVTLCTGEKFAGHLNPLVGAHDATGEIPVGAAGSGSTPAAPTAQAWTAVRVGAVADAGNADRYLLWQCVVHGECLLGRCHAKAPPGALNAWRGRLVEGNIWGTRRGAGGRGTVRESAAWRGR
jgi:hypothetical protein